MNRPKFSPEIARIAADEIVTELVSAGHLHEVDRNCAVADMVKYGRQRGDGYELAKTLDDRAHWDCNFAMVEILEGFSYACDSAIADAEKKWAAETSPQPPFPIGTRVRINADEVGKITGIYEHGAAKYLVKVDGEKEAKSPTNARRIVNFEDVQRETVTA